MEGVYTPETPQDRSEASKRTLRDIPKEVRHSLELLDNILDEYDREREEHSKATLRKKTRDVPNDVRRSLQMLDDILGEYDVDDEDKTERKCESLYDLRNPKAIPQEVSQSLEILDRVLDEFENEAGKHTWRKRNKGDEFQTLHKSDRHEDIRRSLEVLDSVLAEFDDCLESWDSLPPLHNGDELPISEFDRKLEEKENIVLQSNGNLHISQLNSENSPTDGGTSHNSWPSVQEQPKVHSPPPVPKRSLTTRLSDRNSAIFNFPSDDTSLDSYDSTRSFDSNEASLSRPTLRQPISALSVKDDDDAGQNDDVFSLPKIPFESGNCANCGRELGGGTVQMETSPFLQKKQMFEDKASPILTRSLNGSSFRIRKGMEHPSSCINRSPESGFSGSDSSASPLQPPKVIKVAPPCVGVPSPPPPIPLHAPNCNCKERIRQLDIKFAETRKLLRSKKIKELEKPPPVFVPPPPPGVIAKNIRNEIKNAPVEPKVPMDYLEASQNTTSDSYVTAKNHDDSKNIPEDSESGSFRTPPSSRTSDPQSSEPNSLSKNDESFSEIPKGQRLCNRCSRLAPALMSETIEDLPKLHPVDALNRPQLGLSCSMEDDLSPGVKEIIRTSTPKGDIKDMSSLSTFSLSASSLGYVSSQSDLELNNSLTEPEKVPVTSLRSQTLPIGLGLSPSPFYSSMDQGHQNNKGNKFYRDSNFNHTTRAEFESRSSSAPPLPEAEKPKKKHFRGFSRKDKKDKKKNDDSLSIKSDMSFDEGVILRKIESIDGATKSHDAVDRAEVEVEKKRWSVFRSILKKI